MSNYNFAIRGSYTLQETVSALAGEEAYGEQLTRLGVGVDSEDNWADFEPVPSLPDEIDGEIVATDADLMQAIEQRGPQWRLVMVTSLYVENTRRRVALFRKNA